MNEKAPTGEIGQVDFNRREEKVERLARAVSYVARPPCVVDVCMCVCVCVCVCVCLSVSVARKKRRV